MILRGLQDRAERAARAAALGLAGGLVLAVGVGFLTAAAWIALASAQGALTAALVIGSGYAGLGLVLVALGLRGPSRRRPLPPRASDQVPALAAAFLSGFQAAQTRRAPRP